MNLPRSLLEIQILNAYCVKSSKLIRDFIEAKSKRMTSLTFVDSRFTVVNYEKLHFQYADLQTIYKRLLIFGDCKVHLKHFDSWIIIIHTEKTHQCSYLGMFIKRLAKIDGLNEYDMKELLTDMEYIFASFEQKYIDTVMNSFSQLKGSI